MDLKEFLSQLATLSPEERAQLTQVIGGGAVAPASPTAATVDPGVLATIKADLKGMYPSLPDAKLHEMAIQHATRKKTPPSAVTAKEVFFFQQNAPFHTESIRADKENPDLLVKEGYFLPPRVIAVDEKSAWRLYWKQRGKYVYLGRSKGLKWRQARLDGLSVSEASALELEEMQKNPDRTVPPSQEKTVFHGRKISQLARGIQIGWSEGLKGIKD